MFTAEQRFANSIVEFWYASNYEENIETFERAVEVLKDRINHKDFSEFDDDEREILEAAFSLIHEDNDGGL